MPNVIQFTQLGNFGRFGNQMFQYAFARAYAEKYNARLEIPNWIGEKIFKNVSHPKPSKKLARTKLDVVPWGQTNIDLFGYFQSHEVFNILSESKLREWFMFKDEWQKYLSPSNKIVAHLRRGDYLSQYSKEFCIISEESYIDAIGSDIEFLSEESPTIYNDVYVGYSLQKNSMYGRDDCYYDGGISFLPDFFKMINAKTLLRANSTFSFWAGFFNADKVMSPRVGNLVGLQDVKFEEGNHCSIFPGQCDFVFRG